MPKAKKFDQNKAPMSLIPAKALNDVASVLAFGATKYGTHNWRCGMDHTQYSSAAIRHIYQWLDGEDVDPESGYSHLAHAICGLLMLRESEIKGYGIDDRHKED